MAIVGERGDAADVVAAGAMTELGCSFDLTKLGFALVLSFDFQIFF
jgi:hypothetical protein